LMLDEPTNHLDMHSCDLLIDALNKYEGSIILVSHDRYFVSKTANKIWEIVDHQIKEFKGGYEEWVQWKERMAKQEADSKKEQAKQKSPVIENKPVAKPVAAKQQTPINKEAKKELQRVQKQFEDLEKQLAKMNEEKAALEVSLNDPGTYSDRQKFVQTESAYKKLLSTLEKSNLEYENVFEKLTKLSES
jgi:ATP-binding cassette subfamily F protein 3